MVYLEISAQRSLIVIENARYRLSGFRSMIGRACRKIGKESRVE